MKFCPSCGAAQAAPVRFCHQCGVALGAAPPTTGLPALRAAPTTLNIGALTVGLLSVALIASGVSFLVFR